MWTLRYVNAHQPQCILGAFTSQQSEHGPLPDSVNYNCCAGNQTEDPTDQKGYSSSASSSNDFSSARNSAGCSGPVYPVMTRNEVELFNAQLFKFHKTSDGPKAPFPKPPEQVQPMLAGDGQLHVDGVQTGSKDILEEPLDLFRLFGINDDSTEEAMLSAIAEAGRRANQIAVEQIVVLLVVGKLCHLRL